MSNGYLSQEVTLKDSSFVPLPEGNEGIFLSLYILFLPYISGLFFVFVFVSQFQLEVFSELSSTDTTSFIFSWFIGYEFLASISLLIIFFKAITYKPVSRSKVRRY